ncbi:MAG: hybrid sensor histidine kinase/response regulator [Chloroflexi bacterium]|nr:hybrid sensor histidine kinase/response regulator [Chloroflexota bacterium]
MPNNPKDRILVVDDDLQSLDLICKQVLEPLGYQVAMATDGGAALQQIITFAPAVIILSLALRGLSGKDVLTALRSQGFDSPVIVIAPENGEQQALAAFRLGARDYLVRPLREAEIVAAVDRVVEDGRLRRERAQLQQQLTQANTDLQQRVKELTVLSGLGKAVINLTDVASLFNRLVESALQMSGAEMGWLLVADQASGQLLIVAQKNLPGRVQLRQPWDDGLAPLVMLSGEPLAIGGTGILQMKISQIAKAALVMPVKAREQTVGVLTVANRAPKPFTEQSKTLLNAVADYASIAIVNVRLFQALEQRTQAMQQSYETLKAGEKHRGEVLAKITQQMRSPVTQAKSAVDLIMGESGITRMNERQRNQVRIASEKLDAAVQFMDDIAILHESGSVAHALKPVQLDEMARQSMSKYQPMAQQQGVALLASIAASVIVPGDAPRLSRVFDNLIENAIKFSPKGGEVVISIQREGSVAHISVADRGIGIAPEHLPHVFERFFQVDPKTGGVGIGLALVKQIVETHGGQAWAESAPGQGSRFYFTLPKAI